MDLYTIHDLHYVERLNQCHARCILFGFQHTRRGFYSDTFYLLLGLQDLIQSSSLTTKMMIALDIPSAASSSK